MHHNSQSDERLPTLTRAFHWGTVVLMVSMFSLIWIADWFGQGPFGAYLVELHRSIGTLLFVVVVARLVWRLLSPTKPFVISGSVWEHRLASVVQALMYAALLAMPLLGWAASDTAGDTVRVFGLFKLPSFWNMNEDLSNLLFTIHGWVAIGLLALAALHVSGALRHHFILRDTVLKRML